MTAALSMVAPAGAVPAHRVIQTARLTLRPLERGDGDALHPVFADPDSMRYWNTPPHPDRETTDRLMERWCVDDDTQRCWAVTVDGGRCLGTVNLFGVANRIGSLGYLLQPAARGRGFATEACRAVLEYGFGSWNLHRVEAMLDPRNAASAAVLDRLGFVREGLKRQDFLLGDTYCDTLICGLLAADWRVSGAARHGA